MVALRGKVFTEKLEKQIDALGKEIAQAWICFDALHDWIEQSNNHKKVGQDYPNLSNYMYLTFYNELIHSISRLQDPSKDSLSIIKLFKRLEIEGKLTDSELELFDQIKKNDIAKRIVIIRDKLGRAHLDSKISINSERQKELLARCTMDLSEIGAYIELLNRALEILSERLSRPVILLRPSIPMCSEIRALLKRLDIES